ncbi:MAG: HDOD domain-containing protein [Epsilonproteobacteria bacterium]|nr:HDOD domain-containing protein [Campylobacterota bacterium]
MGIIGRQAISNVQGQIELYDILFRQEHQKHDIHNDIAISASVLDRILNTFGADRVLGPYKGCLKVDTEFLQNDIIGTIPKERFVLMLLQSTLADEHLLGIVSELHKQGFVFGINDFKVTPQNANTIAPLLPFIDYIKIDTLTSDSKLALMFAKKLTSLGKRVIASKIETFESYQEYLSHKTELFQGYYIERPCELETDSLSSDHESILRIWDMLRRDVSIGEVVDALEKNHILALQLMQFINSSFFSFSRPIRSILQIVNLLGRRALSNWLLLMMVSSNNNKKVNHPLILMVINRTEIMCGLAKLIDPKISKDDLETVYLVGMLSLIHLLLNIEHRIFLHKLNVSEEIEEAMFEATSYWGQLLTMTRYIEHADSESLRPYIQKYHLKTEQIELMIVEAMERVNAFDELLNQDF